MKDQTYWQNFYTSFNYLEPSTFAKFITPYLSKGRIIDLGCGNGRDSLYFAQLGLDVVAIDSGSSLNYDCIDFRQDDFTNLPDESFDFIYSRFTLHAIDKIGEQRILEWCKHNLNKNGKLFIEARTIRDEIYGIGQSLPDNAWLSDHYRRFLDPTILQKQLEDLGFKVLYIDEGQFSPFGESNPMLVRVVIEIL